MDWLHNVLSPLKKLQLSATIIFLAFITACGSGGFDEPEDTGTGTTNVITVTLSISDTNVTAAKPATVTATVSSNATGVLKGVVVTFTSPIGNINPSSGTALTNENGQATIELRAGTTAGAGEISAEISSGEIGSIGFTTTGDESSNTGKKVEITSSNTHVTNATPATLTVSLTLNGTAIAGEVVQFTTTRSNAQNVGAFAPASGTVLTNSQGQATILLLAGSLEGAGIVTATVLTTGESNTIGFTTAGDSTGTSKSIQLALSNTQVTAAAPVIVTATISRNGAPLAGEIVQFKTPTCGSPCNIGLFDPASGGAITDANGVATITLIAGKNAGAGVVTATLTSGEENTIGFVTAGDSTGTTAKVITFEPPNTNINITAATPVTLNIKLTRNNASVPNEIIKFQATKGGAFGDPIGIILPLSGTALTDANGNANVLLSAGTVAGVGLVTATVVSTGESNTLTFTTAGDDSTGGESEKSITVKIDNVSVDAANPRTITATVEKAGVGVAGEVVNFTTTLGALDPVSGTALTGPNGEATIRLTAGSIPGAGLVTARTTTNESNTVGFTTAGDLISNVTLSLELTDTNGVVLSPRQISSTTKGKIRATVTGIDQPVIVTFSTDLGNIPVPTAITNSANIAIVDIFAANSLGAGTVTGTLTTGETAQLVFSIGASSLGIGTSVLDASNLPDSAIEIPAGNLSAGGTTTLSVTIWNTSVSPPVPFTDSVDVSFSSNCSNLATPTATVDSAVTTVNGVASSTYLAQGCQGDDIVTATANAGGIVLSATGTVSINSASVGSMVFISATPQNIALKGIGGTESSTLVFKVLDSNGNPVKNKQVDFSISTSVGGITFNPANAVTNSNGLVQTVVNSGTVSTPVRITASVNGSSPLISTQSSLLVISTGIPDQDSFSLSANILNPEGWSIDGSAVTVTARLADAFNNPVPDGTAVSFTTEGGAIAPSCTTTGGACSVIWTSQNPRPDGLTLAGQGALPQITNTMGQSYGGRATILAYAIGNESFPDLNGNGVFDASEEAAFNGNDISGLPYDLSEAFVDHNEDGVYNPQVAGGQAGGNLEEFVDFNTNTTFDLADNKYNGVLCGDSSICSTQKLLNVRGSIVLVMSGSGANFLTTSPPGGAAIAIIGEGTGSASVIIADLHNQPMPAGTTVVFSATVGSVVSKSSFTWGSDNNNGGTAFGVTVKGENQPKSGALLVTVTTPNGAVTIYTVAQIVIS